MRPLLAAAAAAALLVPTPAQEPLPRRSLFDPAVRTDVQLSPDGTLVGWIEPRAGRRRLFVAAVEDPGAARCVSGEGEGESDVLEWLFAHTDEHVLFTRAVDGGGDVHLHVAPRQGGSIFDVTPDARGPLRLAGHNRVWRTYVVLEYEPAGEERGLWLFEFIEKRPKRLGDGGFERYTFDFNMWPVVAGGRRDGTAVVARMLDTREWEVVRDGSELAEGATLGVVAGEIHGQKIYFTDGGGRAKAVLVELDARSGEERVVLADPLADLDPLHHHVGTREQRPHAMTSWYGGPRRHVLDGSVASDYAVLEGALPGFARVVHQTVDDRKWLVAEIHPAGPPAYHLYDRDAQEARRLFGAQPSLEGVAAPPVRRLVAPSRDGLALPCELVLPAGADADGDGVPDVPLPAVVWVHDLGTAPWDDDLAADRSVQLLASRGYAVVRAEYRGSFGYGSAWYERGAGELGARMVDDVVDVARWIAREGVADPDRIAVAGWSYGGYAALLALARAPGTFACGIALSAPTDLEQFVTESAAAAHERGWIPRAGDPSTETGRALLREQSPLLAVASLARPVLVAHGGADRVVPEAHSARLAEAAREAGAPVTVLRFGAEEHRFERPGTWIAMWAVGERFLAEHLGGRCEPPSTDTGADLEDGMEVVAGGEHVPGLAPVDDARGDGDDEASRGDG